MEDEDEEETAEEETGLPVMYDAINAAIDPSAKSRGSSNKAQRECGKVLIQNLTCTGRGGGVEPRDNDIYPDKKLNSSGANSRKKLSERPQSRSQRHFKKEKIIFLYGRRAPDTVLSLSPIVKYKISLL
jgi:hypothetical protein